MSLVLNHRRPRLSCLYAAALAATLAAAAPARAVEESGQLVAWGSVTGGAALAPQPPALLPVRSVACAGPIHRTAMVMADGSLRIFPQGDPPAVLQAPGSCRAVFGGFQGYFAVLQPDGAFRMFWSNSWSSDTAWRLFEGETCTMAALTWSNMLVLRTDGAVLQYCYGGDGACGEQNLPEDLGPCRWIASGDSHCLAVRVDGSVRAWGANDYGQVDGPAPNESCVARPSNLGSCTQVAGGYAFSLALQQDGTVRAWGDNYARYENEDLKGQCDVPPDLAGVTGIAAGTSHSVALLSDGSVRAWGSNYHAQCAGQPTGGSLCRIKPDPMGAAGQVAVGESTTFAVLADGSVEAWGNNSYGDCDTPRSTGQFTHIGVGAEFVMGVRADGTVDGWGRNDWGQVGGVSGDGIAARPQILPPCQRVDGGLQHTLALTRDGVVLAWGDNRYGQCDVPFDLGPCTQISAADTLSYAIQSDGTLRRWGTDTSWWGMDPPENLGPCIRIAAGADHAMAIEVEGAVRAWGRNDLAQCDGPPPYEDTVQRPANLGPCTEVAVGGSHSLALQLNGRVRAWGWNSYGESLVPEDLKKATAIAAGSIASMALREDGSVRVWGYIDPWGVPPPTAGEFRSISSKWMASYAIASGASSDCEGAGAAGTATPRVNGSPWSDIGVWQWSDGGARIPGSASVVDLGEFGSVGSDCAAEAGVFVARAGSTLYVPVTFENPIVTTAHAIRVDSNAVLAGTLSVQVRGASGTLPADMAPIPVMSAATVAGSFDLLLSSLPPPAGKFLTLAPETVNDRQVLSLRLLDLPNGAQLNGGSVAGFSGLAVAAAAIDLNHDGFDDLALAVSFGPDAPGALQVLLNDGTGTLGAGNVLRPLPPEPTCLTVGDLNGDGNLDIVAGAKGDATVRTFEGDAGGGLTPKLVIPFQNETPLSVAVLPASAASLLPTSSRVAVGTSGSRISVLGGSSGTMEQQVPVAGTPTTVRGGSTSGSDSTDIVTGGTTSSTVALNGVPQTGFVQVLRETANGFVLLQSLTLSAKPLRLELRDMDGDGLAEILTANAAPTAGAPGAAVPVLSLFRNRGTSFSAAIALAPPGASEGLDVALVDADSDGDCDIVSVHRTLGTASEATLLRVDSNGPDAPLCIGEVTVLPVARPTLVARGKLDGVGGEDVFLVGASTGNFSLGGAATPFLGSDGGLFGDLDGSGTVDNGDVALCLLDYGPCPGCSSDLDGNEIVDFGDIALILLSFG